MATYDELHKADMKRWEECRARLQTLRLNDIVDIVLALEEEIEMLEKQLDEDQI